MEAIDSVDPHPLFDPAAVDPNWLPPQRRQTTARLVAYCGFGGDEAFAEAAVAGMPERRTLLSQPTTHVSWPLALPLCIQRVVELARRRRAGAATASALPVEPAGLWPWRVGRGRL